MSLSKELGGFIPESGNGKCHRKTFRVDKWRPKLLSFFNTPCETTNTLPSLLKGRELGLVKNSNFGTNLMELKSDGARTQFSAEEIGHEGWLKPDWEARNIINDISVLKGNSETLYAVWHTDSDSNYTNYVGDIRHFLSPSLYDGYKGLGLKPVNFEVIDICEAFIHPRSLVAVGNCPKASTGLVLFVTPEYEIFVVRRSCRKRERAPVWCCAACKFSNIFACGRQDFITFIDMGNDKFLRMDIPGNIHAVEFNNIGNLVYTGAHNGKFAVLDRRQPGIASEMKFPDQGIDETKLLSDEQTVILAGMQGMLCKVDLRQNDIVTMYEGHIRSTKKIPFSFSEEFNLLCATGSDSTVRLWSLDDGRPIKQYQNEDPTVPSRAWLMSTENKCFLYHVEHTTVRAHKIICPY